MRHKNVVFTTLQVSSSFFVNLATGYFFALYTTKTIWVLINNIVACILCLYIAIYIAHFLSHE